MLDLSLAAILEKNKIAQDNVWLVLLEIQCPDGEVIRLVSNTEDITWDGNQWVAFPFLIDSVKTNKTEVPQVPVKVSNITKAIERVIEEYDGFIGCTVVLRVVMSKHLELAIPEIEETFTVQGTSSNYEWAEFTLGGSLPIMMRFPFRRILKDWCPFVYKDIECAATSGNTTCTHTLTGCRANGNSARFGGENAISSGGLYA